MTRSDLKVRPYRKFVKVENTVVVNSVAMETVRPRKRKFHSLEAKEEWVRASQLKRIPEPQLNKRRRSSQKHSGFTEESIKHMNATYAKSLNCTQVTNGHRMTRCRVCDTCLIVPCLTCKICKGRANNDNSAKRKCRMQYCSNGYVPGCQDCTGMKNARWLAKRKLRMSN